jgi:MFS family permease
VTAAEVRLRDIAVPAFLPAALQATGVGALAPAVALSARGLGAGLGTAGLLVALLGVGQVAGDIPAGILAARLGERRAMLASMAGAVAAAGLCLLASLRWHSLPLLAAGVLVIGLTNAVFGLARQSFLTDMVPAALRARAMSTLGGMFRVGSFAGPLAATPLVIRLGAPGGFAVHLLACLLTAAVLAVVADPRTGTTAAEPVPGGTRGVARQHGVVLGTLGVSGVLIGAVRASRQVVVPLWAEHLGLDAAAVNLIFAISGGLDLLAFYPSGRLMDHRGRAAVAVPSMAVLGLAHLLLPLTSRAVTLTAVALLMGLGNGMGSGVVMTLAADVAPVRGRAEFLGVWRIFHDAGSTGGPLLLTAAVAGAGLAAGITVMGVVALGTAALLARWIPRHGAGAAQARDRDSVDP